MPSTFLVQLARLKGLGSAHLVRMTITAFASL